MFIPKPPRRPAGSVNRARRFTLLAASLSIALLAPTAGPAGAQDGRAVVGPHPAHEVPVQPGDDVGRDRPVRTVEQLRLACAPDLVGGQRGVLCKWSPTTYHTARAYELYRIVDGSPRHLVATVGADARLGYFDTDVSAPSHLVYGVVARDAAGRVVGVGGPVRVQFGEPNEVLRVVCAPDSVGGERGVLCRWSQTARPDARGYLLYRAVASEAREVVARVGLDERRAYFDTDITPGAAHLYFVAVVDREGTVIGSGGPVRVQWPDAGRAD